MFLPAPVLNCWYPFSTLLSYGWFNLLVAAFLVVIAVGLLAARHNRIGIGFLLLGGCWIILERQFGSAAGCVKDNLSFFGLFNFNAADILVTGGVLFIIYENYLRRR